MTHVTRADDIDGLRHDYAIAQAGLVYWQAARTVNGCRIPSVEDAYVDALTECRRIDALIKRIEEVSR